MKIAIAGSTGVLGRRVAARLLERGHQVTALVRPEGRPLPLAHDHLRTVAGDIFDAQALEALMEGADVALHLATAIPAAGPNMDWSMNDRIRRDGAEMFLQAATERAVERCLFQGICMITPGAAGAWVDERSEVAGNPVVQSAIDMEALIAAYGLPSTILRGGMFYGPGAGNTAAWNAQARQGALTTPGDGSDHLSLIHVDDMSQAFVLAVEGAPPEPILNIVDDHPPTWSELFGHIARGNGQATVASGAPRRFPNFRVSNSLAKRTLGWRPSYPSFLSGWAFE